MLRIVLSLVILISLKAHAEKKRKPSNFIEKKYRHAHLMHLDGFNSKVFKWLIENGNLPNFNLLLNNGKISYKASTVDKSETMKVILSYLTSKIDTKVVGWWQFNPENYNFRNFWLDPVEVVNYAIGLDFPVYPTIFDILADKGEEVVSGFALHRRNVTFENYSRAYYAGIKGVFEHKYFDQANDSMDGLIKLYTEKANQKKVIPRFSHSLLAAADEFSHLEGVTVDHIPFDQNANFQRVCYKKGKGEHPEQFDIIFKLLNENQTLVDHFLSVNRQFIVGKFNEFCLSTPIMDFHFESNTKVSRMLVNPKYVLGMIMIDIQLGKFIKTLKNIKAECLAKDHREKSCTKGKNSSKSVFDNTYFVLTGDHGMVDTKSMTNACAGKDCKKYGRKGNSVNKTFISQLNEKLGLKTPNPNKGVKTGDLLGIDDSSIPMQLKFPHLVKSWQDQSIKAFIKEGDAWSLKFMQEMEKRIKSGVGRKYWWLFFLKKFYVYPKVDQSLEDYKILIKNSLTQLWLRGIPQYIAKEKIFLKNFYKKHIRLVYGGGARNNAELFLINKTDAWKNKIREVLKKVEAVGLVFERRNNPLLKGDYFGKMFVDVWDRYGNLGEISVFRDKKTLELVFGYKNIKGNPLLAADFEDQAQVYGTYQEWNDRSVNNGHLYHNVVAGMGSYLYSKNISIGDFVIMHAQGWNFGDNAAGHGGLAQGEKLTVMIASGPNMSSGELMSNTKFKTQQSEGQFVSLEANSEESYPTVLDVAPSIMKWLGYNENILTNYSRSQAFKKNMAKWSSKQKNAIATNIRNVADLNRLFKDYGMGKVKLKGLEPYFQRIFQFIDLQKMEYPDFNKQKQDGNLLINN